MVYIATPASFVKVVSPVACHAQSRYEAETACVGNMWLTDIIKFSYAAFSKFYKSCVFAFYKIQRS